MHLRQLALHARARVRPRRRRARATAPRPRRRSVRARSAPAPTRSRRRRAGPAPCRLPAQQRARQLGGALELAERLAAARELEQRLRRAPRPRCTRAAPRTARPPPPCAPLADELLAGLRHELADALRVARQHREPPALPERQRRARRSTRAARRASSPRARRLPSSRSSAFSSATSLSPTPSGRRTHRPVCLAARAAGPRRRRARAERRQPRRADARCSAHGRAPPAARAARAPRPARATAARAPAPGSRRRGGSVRTSATVGAGSSNSAASASISAAGKPWVCSVQRVEHRRIDRARARRTRAPAARPPTAAGSPAARRARACAPPARRGRSPSRPAARRAAPSANSAERRIAPHTASAPSRSSTSTTTGAASRTARDSASAERIGQRVLVDAARARSAAQRARAPRPRRARRARSASSSWRTSVDSGVVDVAAAGRQLEHVRGADLQPPLELAQQQRLAAAARARSPARARGALGWLGRSSSACRRPSSSCVAARTRRHEHAPRRRRCARSGTHLAERDDQLVDGRQAVERVARRSARRATSSARAWSASHASAGSPGGRACRSSQPAAAERVVAGEQQPQRHAEREHVRLHARRFAAQQLGRHERQRAAGRPAARASRPITRARPKSITCAAPRASMMALPGLMSPCTTPTRCSGAITRATSHSRRTRSATATPAAALIERPALDVRARVERR